MAKLRVNSVADDRYWIHAKIRYDRSTYREDPEYIQQIRDYVRGKQTLTLTTEQKAALKGLTEEETKNVFADNVVKQIIAETVGRLVFEGWECENEQVKDNLSQFYTKAKVKDRQGMAHWALCRDGNHLLYLGWNAERQMVDFSREKWWNGVDGSFLAYDDNDRPYYAVKEWREYDINNAYVTRRVIYLDNELQRWISRDDGNTWEPYQLTLRDENGRDTGKLEMWPVPWLKKDGVTPLRIPFIHFPNAGDEIENYGISELDGGLMACQDQINDLRLSMMVSARQNAYQMYFATGVMTVDPITKKVIRYKAGPGVVWASQKADAKFGVLQAGSPDGIISIYNKVQARMSQQARVPLHIITGGDWPSGEALLRAERPAVDKAKSQIAKLETCWVLLAHRQTEIYNRFHKSGPDLEEDADKATITARYADPEMRDPLSQATVIEKLGEKISDGNALRMMGWSEARIEQNAEEKDDEADVAAKRFQVAFSRGVAPGSQLPGKGEPANGEDADGNAQVPESNP